MSAPTTTCPVCGEPNSVDAVLCQICGADISGAAGLRSNTATPSELRGAIQATSQPIPLKPRQVKICPQCGTQNDSVDVLCGECGGNIREVPPSPAAAGPVVCPRDGCSPAAVTMLEPAPPKLWLVVGTQVFQCNSGDVLGRAGNLASQVFAGIPTVSGQHVALELHDNVWHVVNLPPQPGKPGKNVTVIDGREVPIGRATPLTGEHVIRLSSRCEVRLRVSNA